jgi:hypothetical protein
MNELQSSEMSSANSLRRDREIIADVNLLFLERIILLLKTSHN